LEFEVLMTEDADLGLPIPLPIPPPGTPDIHTLLIHAGFVWNGREGGDLYSLGEEGNFYVEFIAPLMGSATDRDGKPKSKVQVGGVNVEMFRYVDLLLKEPWEYSLVPEHGFSSAKEQCLLRVVNPISYLMQKVLTVGRRPQDSKKAKDVLYIHDTLLIFGENLDNFQDLAERLLIELPPKTQNEFHRLRDKLFTSSLTQGAAQIAKESGRLAPPSAQRVQEVCREGLAVIFAP
jgi:hypothetical protein